MAGSPRYRVEHHCDGTCDVLATLTEGAPHFRTLDPFVIRLLLEGRTGWVYLVDARSDQTLIRREIRASRCKAWFGRLPEATAYRK